MSESTNLRVIRRFYDDMWNNLDKHVFAEISRPVLPLPAENGVILSDQTSLSFPKDFFG